MKKKIFITVEIIVIVIFCIYASTIYNGSNNNEKNNTKENINQNINQNKNQGINQNSNPELVDLSQLDSYMGGSVNNDKAIELLEKIKNEYKMYLSDSTGTGEKDSTGIYIYFSNDVEANSETIKNNANISMIDDYISTREYDKDRGYFYISKGIDEQNRQFVYLEKNTKIIDYGIITSINNNVITIKNKEIDYQYEITVDKDKQLTNYRTTENMNLSDLKIGDYYNSGEIIRNITGEEWKKECIKNLAYCYDEGNLVCNPERITNVENKGNYVIITLIMGDSSTEYINGKNNIETFELQAIAYSNLNISTSSGNVNIYNLKEETEGFMFWIGLDKNTINNKYPCINNIEIYDK